MPGQSPSRAGLFGSVRADQLRQYAKRPMMVLHAALGDTPPPSLDEPGSVDLRTVNSRMDHIRAEAGDGVAAWPHAARNWYDRVSHDGDWDDRAKTGPAAERQGNFSFGATAAALGLPLPLAQFGAGARQRLDNIEAAMRGDTPKASVGLLMGAAGGDPRDARVIREGYEYGRQRLGRNR